MGGIWNALFNFSHFASSIGVDTALASVCLSYYVAHVYYLDGTRRKIEDLREELNLAELECRQLGRERSVTRTEIQLLREILAQPDFEKSCELILRRFVPNAQDAIAAVVLLSPTAERRVWRRGLSDATSLDLQIDEDLIESLRGGIPVLLDNGRLAQTRLMASLSVAERKKVRQLAVTGIGSGEEMQAILMTSRLLPICGIPRQQLELLSRVSSSLFGSLSQHVRLHEQNAQLKDTRILLELRAALDAVQADPIRVMQVFLERVSTLVQADRGVVFLLVERDSSSIAPAARHGKTLSAGVETVWQKHEEAIARVGFNARQLSVFNAEHLRRVFVETLIGSALTIPLNSDDRFRGVLCLTRTRSSQFSTHLCSLVENATKVFTNVINRGLIAQEYERQAREDSLTGLANRREFDRQLSREIEAVHLQRIDDCCLLLLDLDRFKKINDDYGHQAGDEVLRVVARVLKDRVSRIRSSDRALLARYGGEEMALILPSFSMPGGLRIAEQIREAIEATLIEYENQSIRATVSIGVACCPLHALTAQDLLEAADQALYEAKTRGRNRVCAAVEAPLVESGSGILG